MRSNAQKNELGLKEIMALQEDVQKEWNRLNMLAQTRSFRHQTNNDLKPRKKRSINDEGDASPCTLPSQKTSSIKSDSGENATSLQNTSHSSKPTHFDAEEKAREEKTVDQNAAFILSLRRLL